MRTRAVAQERLTLHADLERVALLGWRLAPTTRQRAGMFSGYLDAATTDLDQIERWSKIYPGSNWCVVPSGSGVFALDVDLPSADHDADGLAALRALTAKHGELPQTTLGRSGGGGWLLVFRDDGAPIKCRSGWPKPGLDPRAGRNSFTIAPSTHRRGGAYRWVRAPWDVAPLPAPAWLLKLLAPPPEAERPPRPFVPTTDAARRQLNRAVENVMRAPMGAGNDTLNRQCFVAARYVAAGLLSEDEAVQALYAAARSRNIPHREAKDTIRSGFSAGLKCPVEARA